MTHIIIAFHNSTIFRISYRNKTIISISRHSSESDPRGQDVPYDSLTLAERESILIAVIEYLNQQ